MHSGVQIWYDETPLSFLFICLLNDTIWPWPYSSRSLISGIIHLTLIWGRVNWRSFCVRFCLTEKMHNIDLNQQYEFSNILFSNIRSSSPWMLNDILTLDHQWLPNRSDFPPISWPWYRTWPSPNYEWFPWSICNGCSMPVGNAYPSGHLIPSPFLGIACAPIVETRCIDMSLLDYSPWIPFGIFSILHCPRKYYFLNSHWMEKDRTFTWENISKLRFL